jgi:thiol-disulfide isomerase/thioredoxin
VVKGAFAARAGLVAATLFGALAPVPAALAQERKPAPPLVFQDEKGERVNLDAFRGKVVLVNFWATWCVPCRDEMPTLSKLQERLGQRGLVVVPIAIDFRGLSAVEDFYRAYGIANLPKYVDENRDAAKRSGFMGIPGSIALDRQGREVFRVEGPLDWAGLAPTTRLESLLAEK